jgi:hypothetical protein
MGVVKSEELNEMEELLIPRMNHIPSTPKNPLIRMEETGILNMISGVSILNDLADLIEEEEELEFYVMIGVRLGGFVPREILRMRMSNLRCY